MSARHKVNNAEANLKRPSSRIDGASPALIVHSLVQITWGHRKRESQGRWVRFNTNSDSCRRFDVHQLRAYMRKVCQAKLRSRLLTSTYS
jgi:hypothetical protein